MPAGAPSLTPRALPDACSSGNWTTTSAFERASVIAKVVRCPGPPSEEGVRGEASPPGLLATRLAGRLVVLMGRDARLSRANVRHPAAAQARTAEPFVLDSLPGTMACRPRSVAGEGTRLRRVLLRWQAPQPCSRIGRRRYPAQLQGGDPYVIPHVNLYVIPYAQGWRTPGLGGRAHRSRSCPLVGASRPRKPRPTGPPRGSGAARPQGALRAIDSTACPHSWRT